MKISYFSGVRRFDEYVSPDHESSYPRKLAREWWRRRHDSEPPENLDGYLANASKLVIPKRIKVHTNKKNAEIVQHEF